MRLETPARHSPLKILGTIATILVPLLFWFAPLGLEPKIQHALAITIFMIMAWMIEVMEHAITGLIGCFLYWALHVTNFDGAFSGFANETPWFLFGAILFGVMATKSGLARRIAFLVMKRVGKSYARILLGLIVADFLLTFIVPSGIARLVIMIPVALGLVEAYGVSITSNIARGMLLVLTYTAALFDKMIIAGAAAITARGLMERVGGVEVLYAKWFIAYLPCSLITVFAAWWLTLRFFPADQEVSTGGTEYVEEELRKMGPWSPMEKRAIVLMLIALSLWLTDFIHHISPSMVGLAVGLVACIPAVRLLEVEDIKKVNILPVFFVGTAISMGSVLVESKALNVLTNVLFGWMAPLVHTVYSSTLILYWTAFVYHIFLASEISMLGTSIPLLMNFAKAHHLDPLALGMVWTFAAGGKIFIYQNAVLIVGYSYGAFRSRDLLKIGFWLTVIESLILLLIVPVYWPLLGI